MVQCVIKHLTNNIKNCNHKMDYKYRFTLYTQVRINQIIIMLIVVTSLIVK